MVLEARPEETLRGGASPLKQVTALHTNPGRLPHVFLFSSLLCCFLKTAWILLRKFCKDFSSDFFPISHIHGIIPFERTSLRAE